MTSGDRPCSNHLKSGLPAQREIDFFDSRPEKKTEGRDEHAVPNELRGRKGDELAKDGGKAPHKNDEVELNLTF